MTILAWLRKKSMARQDRTGTCIHKHCPKSALQILLILAATFFGTIQSAPGHATLILGIDYDTTAHGWFWGGPCSYGNGGIDAANITHPYYGIDGSLALNTREEAYAKMLEDLPCLDGKTEVYLNTNTTCTYTYPGFRPGGTGDDWMYRTVIQAIDNLGPIFTQEYFLVDYLYSCKSPTWSGQYVFLKIGTVGGRFTYWQSVTKKYFIKLVNDAGSSVPGALADVEPGKDATLVAQVYDQNNQLVPNVGVRIEADVVEYTGGHKHPNNAQRPKGKLNNQDPPIVTGSTGAGGFSFTFNAPAPAGDHTLKATCTGGKTCTPQGPDRVWVGVKGLLPLPADSTYALIPNRDVYHPDNHYLTYDAENRMLQLAGLYRARFPNNPVLHLNDASLERGGIFDIYSNWVRPHAEHCMGTVIDIRANDAPGAVPDAIRNEFQRIAANIGVDAMWEVPEDNNRKPVWSLRHYHVRLMGKEGLQCPW